MKILKWLDKYLEEVLLSLMLIGICIVMIAQVISRYVLNASLSWSDEMARYMLVWSCFLSVSYCVKRRISIKIEQLQNALPEKMIPWIKLLRHSIVLIFCIIMIPYTATYLQQTIASGSTSAAMQLPMYYIQSAPLVGFILLTIRVAQAWVREMRSAVLKQPSLSETTFNKAADGFPASDTPGEIWMETQLPIEEELEVREALGTLQHSSEDASDPAAVSRASSSKKGARAK